MTHVGNISNHFDAMHHCLSGQAAAPNDTPYIGSILSKVRPSQRNVASYFWLINASAGRVFISRIIGTGGFLGADYAPMFVGNVDEPSRHARVSAVRTNCLPRVDGARMDDRRQLLDGIECKRDHGPQQSQTREWQELHGRAFDLATGPGGRQVFELRPRARAFAIAMAGILWARTCCWHAGWSRRASASSPSMAGPALAASRRRRPRGSSSWDMHGGHMGMGNAFGTGSYGMGWCLPRLDEALSALIGDLDDRGLLERTLVVVIGEFGRSPRIQHAGPTRSAALAGLLLRHPGRRRHSRRRGLRRIRQDRRLREGQAGASAGPRRHDLPRPRHAPRNPPGPGRLHPADHHGAADPGFAELIEPLREMRQTIETAAGSDDAQARAAPGNP